MAAKTMLTNSLTDKVKRNRNQFPFATAIINGNITILRNLARVPASYYTTPFDKEGNKLVAFAAKVALVMNDDDHFDVLRHLVNEAPKHTNIMPCATGSRGHCVPHVAAKHALTSNAINRVARIINSKLPVGKQFKNYAAAPNVHGKTARDYATVNAVRERLRGRASSPVVSVNNLTNRQAADLFQKLSMKVAQGPRYKGTF